MLSSKFDFSIYKRIGQDSSVIRLVTSWATTQKSVDSLIKALSKFGTI